MLKKISIVVACRNEEDHVVNMIKSVENSLYPLENIEVIIVDGMSQDNSIENINKYALESKLTIKTLKNIKSKTPYAFNLGIKEASGDYIVISGARFVFSSNYFQVIHEVLEKQNEVGCVGGRIINVYSNKISEIISEAMASPFGMGFGNFRTIEEDTFVDTVTPPAFRKEIFEEVGLFDERLTRNQDDDFSYRLIKKGYKILLKSNISIHYTVRASFQKLFKQFKQYGYWKVFVNKKHKTITTYRQVFPLLFLISLILLPLLGFVSNYFFIFFIIELLIYLFLSVTFAIKKNNLHFSTIIKFVCTCLILHLSYGLGYLEGIIHFLVLNKKPASKNEELSR